MEFFTDTAEICIFDPVCLKHRISDAADWWTVPSEALKEMNEANVIFADLGADGSYSVNVEIGQSPLLKQDVVSSILKCQSGVLFIGPGEETTSGGCEPTDEYGGIFLELRPATYIIQIRREKDVIEINIEPTSANPTNSHTRLLSLVS